MKRVDDRGAEGGGQSHGRRIECVIVHYVVRHRADRRVHAGERLLDGPRIRRSTAVGAVQRADQPIGNDAGVDDADARNFRASRSVDVYGMSPANEPSGEVGEECLRAARLRFANRCDEGRDQRDLQFATVFQARSRGGLMPTTS